MKSTKFGKKFITGLYYIFKKGKKYYLEKLINNHHPFNLKNQKNVILFGAAEMGKIYLSLFKQNKIKVIAFCDNDKSKQGQLVSGIKIISVEQLVKDYKTSPIIITSIYDDEIETQLKKLGFKYIWPHYYFSIVYPDKFNNPHWQSSFNAVFKNKDKILKIFKLLADVKSKKTLLNVILYRLLLDRKYLKKINRPLIYEYFDKEVIKVTENEVFVDGGAYLGDTVQGFIKISDNKFEKIYSFEPDTKIFKKLKQFVDKLKDERIKIFKLGLADKTTKLKFSNDGTPGSRISNQGNYIINVSSLDRILSKKKISFIKLDVEGVEIDALYGAKKLIEKNQPKITISVYHHPADLWEIPLLLRKLRPQSKLYLRHYGEFLYDTIGYAI